MDDIQFSYEIAQQDYVEANLLIWRSLKWRPSWAVLLFGIAVLAVPFMHVGPDGYTQVELPSSLLIFGAGIFLVYCSVQTLMPRRMLRKSYAASALQNRTFMACISAQGLRVQGMHSEWRYDWPAILIAQESDLLFVLSTGIQILIFAKRHMTESQVEAVHTFIAAQPAFPGGTTPKF